MRFTTAMFLAASLCLLTTPVVSGTLGVYTNANGTGCALTLHQGESATVYVVGHTSASDPEGGYIGSGEFRIVGLPSGWVATPVPDPAVHLALGDPFGDGAIFTFASLQAGIIPLFSVQVQATSEESNVVFHVERHVSPNPPGGSPLNCPWFQYCDAPCDNAGTCVEDVSLFINAGDCLVAVDQRTWSAVRMLFR